MVVGIWCDHSNQMPWKDEFFLGICEEVTAPRWSGWKSSKGFGIKMSGQHGTTNGQDLHIYLKERLIGPLMSTSKSLPFVLKLWHAENTFIWSESIWIHLWPRIRIQFIFCHRIWIQLPLERYGPQPIAHWNCLVCFFFLPTEPTCQAPTKK